MKNRIIVIAFIFGAVFIAVFTGTGPPVGIAGEKTVSELVANVIGPPSCTIVNFGRHNYGNAKKELAEEVDGFNHFADSGNDPYEEVILEHGPYGYGCKPLVKSILSGVIISESGRVLTLAHGIGPEADNLIFVAWAYAENGPRMLYRAEVVRIDMGPGLDIAELQIVGAQIKFPYIAWGNSDEIITGEKVLVISSPLGLPFTFNECEVAHVRRSKKMLKALFNYNAPCDMLQLSGSFLPGGSSGGPVFNKEGALIGFVQSRIEKEPSTSDEATGGEENRFKSGEEKPINISFVLPANEVKKWLEEGK